MNDQLFRHPFVRRVPLLLLVLAGAFLWRSAFFPQPRTFLWELPAKDGVTRAEVQLWKGPTLVARAEWLNRPAGPLVEQLQLRQGTYRALTFLELSDGGTEQHVQPVEVGREEIVHLSLRPR
jgi:hypothetical protein